MTLTLPPESYQPWMVPELSGIDDTAPNAVPPIMMSPPASPIAANTIRFLIIPLSSQNDMAPADPVGWVSLLAD
jgi:hypothetical protein